ncbi:MAG: 50S ribosomal protein L9 [Anaerolineales bacterium]|nr:50S ribosomal protein L9 [Anaerolineales bacterium]
MKVLLIKDVYKLGRAGDVKRVADGYGRNYLIPQGLAVLATPGAIKQVDRIRSRASEQRAVLNEEMGAVAEQLSSLKLSFAARAGETGKLYGSITSQDVVEAILEKLPVDIKRQQIDMQPLRTLGEHTISIRLTMDLIPEIKVIVFREGEAEPTLPIEPEEQAEETRAVENAAAVEAVVAASPEDTEAAAEPEPGPDTEEPGPESVEDAPVEELADEASAADDETA